MPGESFNHSVETEQSNFENEKIKISQLDKGGLGVFMAAINPGTEVVVDGVHNTFHFNAIDDVPRLEQHADDWDNSARILTDSPLDFRCPDGFIISDGCVRGVIQPDSSDNRLNTKLSMPLYHKDGTKYEKEEFFSHTEKQGNVTLDRLDMNELGVFMAASNPGIDVVIRGLHNTMEWDENTDKPVYKQQRLHQLDTSSQIITDDIKSFRCPDGFIISNGRLEGIIQSADDERKTKINIPFFHTDGTQY